MLYYNASVSFQIEVAIFSILGFQSFGRLPKSSKSLNPTHVPDWFYKHNHI